jgi:two-component system, sensor histidine kinase YesM
VKPRFDLANALWIRFYHLIFVPTYRRSMFFRCLLILFPLLWLGYAPSLSAQDKKSAPASSKIKKGVKDLKEAADAADAAGIAAAYEQLADDYFQKGEFKKAEEYYEKAKIGFARLGKNDDLARTTRQLAKAQEAQNKILEATQNFENAAANIPLNESDGVQNSAAKRNLNDAQRLKNAADPVRQQPYINDNIDLSKSTGNKEDLADDYGRLGENNLLQNKIPEAIKNYETALAETQQVDQAIKFTNQLSNAYTSSGKYDEAIAVQQKLLEREGVQNSVPAQISQMQNLADIYTKMNREETALSLLNQSYRLALRENRTIDAKNSLEKIALLYVQRGDKQASIDLYRQFLSKLDSLLHADHSILEEKIIAETETKIEQLELEKALKDQLIDRQNRFNYVLAGASLLLFVSVLLIGRALLAIRLKNKKIALQSLRREMNPHFVFNSLNSVNQFIAQNKELEANKYLTAYSNLMRGAMENSNKDFLALSSELEMLKKYLDLEYLRFPEKFEYEIRVAETVDPDAEQIPNMLIQPHLENAIWHGLRYKTEKGRLLLEVYKENGHLIVRIDDDGIGLSKSKDLKTANQNAYDSRGLSNIRERIRLLNEIYGKNIRYDLSEKTAPETGTRVELRF